MEPTKHQKMMSEVADASRNAPNWKMCTYVFKEKGKQLDPSLRSPTFDEQLSSISSRDSKESENKEDSQCVSESLQS